MQTHLNDLIERIKKEGVGKAEEDASRIIEEAKKKADGILKEAEIQKAAILEDGKAKVDSYKKMSEEALKNAARDVLLGLRGRVMEFSDRIVKEAVSEGLSIETLKKVILSAVSNFTKDRDLDIEVLVSADDLKKLQRSLHGALGKEARKHVSLKASDGVSKGFRIGEAGKDSYIDFTDEAISEAFSSYLNPKLVEILDINPGLSEDNAQ